MQVHAVGSAILRQSRQTDDVCLVEVIYVGTHENAPY